jgi:hypothetical protein
MLLDEIGEIFKPGVEGLKVLMDPKASRVLLSVEEVVPMDLTFGLDELRTRPSPIALIAFSPGDAGETCGLSHIVDDDKSMRIDCSRKEGGGGGNE